ncbi:hypothetical protein D049_4131B, partial [Vibrio parahaemolyticus VPTS-2010]
EKKQSERSLRCMLRATLVRDRADAFCHLPNVSPCKGS